MRGLTGEEQINRATVVRGGKGRHRNGGYRRNWNYCKHFFMKVYTPRLHFTFVTETSGPLQTSRQLEEGGRQSKCTATWRKDGTAKSVNLTLPCQNRT